ncbi:hypothetical protein BGW42_006910 [Actinomortierella wolfii]|nr:hypothetical protein BGW42_006910 [Actinomortierella wolfii]
MNIETISSLRRDCLSHERPEVRAKTSIGTFELLEQAVATATESLSDDKDNLMVIWSTVLIGLSDSWPLVREAYLEQLFKHHVVVDQVPSDHTTPSDQRVFDWHNIDKVLIWADSSSSSSYERLRIATGSLILVKEHLTKSSSSGAFPLSDHSISLIALMISRGWQESYDPRVEKTSEDASNSLSLLVQTLSNTQLISVLGATMTPSLDHEKYTISIAFIKTALKLATERQHIGPTYNDGTPLDNTVKDWRLAHWMCDQLQIPTWFESKARIYESTQLLEQAKRFVNNAAILLGCMKTLLRLQKLDNSFTVHRILVAGASFTNPRDTWMASNLLPPGSPKLATIAHNLLNHVKESTPWTLVTSPSSATSKPPSSQYPEGTILIPGTFSDNVIQVLEQTRIFFTNRRATQMAERAKVAIDTHQQILERQQLLQSEAHPHGTQTSLSPLKTKGVRPRIKLADAGDEAIEMDEPYFASTPSSMTIHQHEQQGISHQFPRWDRERLESLSVVEWCAQQRVDNPAKIHPVLMLLLAPILGCIESNVLRFQVRALRLLKQFLTMYHPLFASFSSTNDADHPVIDEETAKTMDEINSHSVSTVMTSSTPTPPHGAVTGSTVGDPLIWIKIFERTGLDQVFARALRPLLHPLRPQTDLESASGAAVAGQGEQVLEPGTTAQQALEEELEMIHTAFQTYLVLLAVNTEDKYDADEDEKEYSGRKLFQNQSKDSGQDECILSVEELFVAGVLGSTLTVNPSDQYRTVILDWMGILIQEYIDGSDLVRDPSSTTSAPATIITKAKNPVAVLQGLGRRTIKHLPAVVRFVCEMLELPVPTAPWSTKDAKALAITSTKRRLRLELLYHAAKSLQILIGVTQASQTIAKAAKDQAAQSWIRLLSNQRSYFIKSATVAPPCFKLASKNSVANAKLRPRVRSRSTKMGLKKISPV